MQLKEILETSFDEDLEGVYRLFNIHPDQMRKDNPMPFFHSRKEGKINHAEADQKP